MLVCQSSDLQMFLSPKVLFPKSPDIHKYLSAKVLTYLSADLLPAGSNCDCPAHVHDRESPLEIAEVIQKVRGMDHDGVMMVS